MILDLTSSRCPRCGRVQPQVELCPACLFATAVSLGVDPCPYEVVTPIDEDAQAVTWLAQYTTGFPQHVALKIYAHRDDIGDVLTRYRQWKPILARLAHPSIARLLDVGLTDDGHLFVAFEYVAGRTLTAGTLASMGMDDRVEVARQLHDAVAAAHAAGVVHLKLSPSKVRFSTSPALSVAILGFGSGLIVDGLAGAAEADRVALERILDRLNTSPGPV
jgi:serine/threonine-protein kinase